MRDIVLDTETTGLDPGAGHRVVEIGAIELVNFVPTGRHLQKYINPERAMPEEARAVHGLSDEFLAQHPPFADIAEEFCTFVAGARLVIHNAQFDMGFLNAELARLGRPMLDNQVIDTVSLARRKFPGAPASLDALCRRFAIDNSARSFHGALLDAELLAEVYLELSGGRQPDLALAGNRSQAGDGLAPSARTVRPVRPHAPTAEELEAHKAFLSRLSDPLWLKPGD